MKGTIIYKARGPIYTLFPISLIAYYLFNPDFKTTAVWFFSGIALIILGGIIRFFCASYIGTCGRAFNVNVPKLRTTGPYTYVRNPIYIANFLWIGGMAIMARLPWMIPVFYAILILIYISIIPFEESYLLQTFGDEYREYCKKVHRIIPKLNPRGPKEERHYDLKKGLVNEMHTFLLFVSAIGIIYFITFTRGGL